MINRIPIDVKRWQVRVVPLLLVLFSLSCQSQSDSRGNETSQEFVPVVQEPVERDLQEIKESGVLRMITHYSSNTYFLHQGIEVGFEYELLKAFAREQDLILEVVIIESNENPYDILNSGEGDVIAANYTINRERERYVSFTRPYNLVDQMVVFSSDLKAPPQTLEELAESDMEITIGRNSSYYHTVNHLIEQGHDLNVRAITEDLDTESLLINVVHGSIEATVSDNNMFQATSRYLDGLKDGPVIAERDSIAWGVRKNAPDLLDSMNKFLYRHFRFTADSGQPRRSEFLNVLRQRYFENGPQIAEYFNPSLLYPSTGLISPYDDVIKSVADSLDLDWLMLTAMIAQESQFNPTSKSWAGAVGLMQIIPRFSEVQYEELYQPEVNIQEGARILKEHLDHYAYLDSLNQWSFALATYNVGMGHMADARRIVIERNGNPNDWDQVSRALLQLMQRRYYQDAKYGYARGIETVQYVEEIMHRYRMYQRVMTVAEVRGGTRMPGIIGAGLLTLP
ncbi:MAG: transporter substrate-binding domain-containing protein [Balneolaceae bacterium]